eukprot:TRINITY_DN3168_c0_g1_i1.p1 TRINITY_DN3168_c0_g1~~TRINITY_DN3168_c0_g1_i1.p1  ORF type:complete len:179 (+),score=11.17 TRINITY_DN3168_c0_g1_i1:49-537(+)
MAMYGGGYAPGGFVGGVGTTGHAHADPHCAPMSYAGTCAPAPHYAPVSHCAPAPMPVHTAAPCAPTTVAQHADTDQVVEMRYGRHLVEVSGTPIYKKYPAKPGLINRFFGPKVKRVVGYNHIKYKPGEYVEDSSLVNVHTGQTCEPDFSQCVGPVVDVVPLG